MLSLPRAQQLEGELPQEVLALLNWLPWLALPRAGGGIGKAPALPRRGRLSPVDSRQAGLPWPEALDLAWQHRAGGVGVALRPGDQLSVLDLDGPLDQERQALLDRLPGYAEVSPSGTGVHVWLVGSPPGARRRRGMELLAGGFVSVTARPLRGRSRALGSLAQVQDLCGFGAVDRPTLLPNREARGCPRADREVLAALYSARNGAQARQLLEGDRSRYSSASEADFAAARVLRFYTDDPAQIERLLRASALDRPKFSAGDYLQRTIHRALALGGPTMERR
jgi:primase-polymerase (primpol)-like protein